MRNPLSPETTRFLVPHRKVDDPWQKVSGIKTHPTIPSHQDRASAVAMQEAEAMGATRLRNHFPQLQSFTTMCRQRTNRAWAGAIGFNP